MQRYAAVAVREAHLVARPNAEAVTQFLGYDDLSLRSDRMSHTIKYKSMRGLIISTRWRSRI